MQNKCIFSNLLLALSFIFISFGLQAQGFTPYRIPGDLNWDNRVDQTDVDIFSAHWQESTVGLSPEEQIARGDINTDGLVDVTDLGILATNWQRVIAMPRDYSPTEIDPYYVFKFQSTAANLSFAVEGSESFDNSTTADVQVLDLDGNPLTSVSGTVSVGNDQRKIVTLDAIPSEMQDSEYYVFRIELQDPSQSQTFAIGATPDSQTSGVSVLSNKAIVQGHIETYGTFIGNHMDENMQSQGGCNLNADENSNANWNIYFALFMCLGLVLQTRARHANKKH